MIHEDDQAERGRRLDRRRSARGAPTRQERGGPSEARERDVDEEGGMPRRGRQPHQGGRRRRGSRELFMSSGSWDEGILTHQERHRRRHQEDNENEDDDRIPMIKRSKSLEMDRPQYRNRRRRQQEGVLDRSSERKSTTGNVMGSTTRRNQSQQNDGFSYMYPTSAVPSPALLTTTASGDGATPYSAYTSNAPLSEPAFHQVEGARTRRISTHKNTGRMRGRALNAGGGPGTRKSSSSRSRSPGGKTSGPTAMMYSNPYDAYEHRSKNKKQHSLMRSSSHDESRVDSRLSASNKGKKKKSGVVIESSSDLPVESLIYSNAWSRTSDKGGAVGGGMIDENASATSGWSEQQLLKHKKKKEAKQRRYKKKRYVGAGGGGKGERILNMPGAVTMALRRTSSRDGNTMKESGVSSGTVGLLRSSKKKSSYVPENSSSQSEYNTTTAGETSPDWSGSSGGRRKVVSKRTIPLARPANADHRSDGTGRRFRIFPAKSNDDDSAGNQMSNRNANGSGSYNGYGEGSTVTTQSLTSSGTPGTSSEDNFFEQQLKISREEPQFQRSQHDDGGGTSLGALVDKTAISSSSTRRLQPSEQSHGAKKQDSRPIATRSLFAVHGYSASSSNALATDPPEESTKESANTYVRENSGPRADLLLESKSNIGTRSVPAKVPLEQPSKASSTQSRKSVLLASTRASRKSPFDAKPSAVEERWRRGIETAQQMYPPNKRESWDDTHEDNGDGDFAGISRPGPKDDGQSATKRHNSSSNNASPTSVTLVASSFPISRRTAESTIQDDQQYKSVSERASQSSMKPKSILRNPLKKKSLPRRASSFEDIPFDESTALKRTGHLRTQDAEQRISDSTTVSSLSPTTPRKGVRIHQDFLPTEQTVGESRGVSSIKASSSSHGQPGTKSMVSENGGLQTPIVNDRVTSGNTVHSDGGFLSPRCIEEQMGAFPRLPDGCSPIEEEQSESSPSHHSDGSPLKPMRILASGGSKVSSFSPLQIPHDEDDAEEVDDVGTFEYSDKDGTVLRMKFQSPERHERNEKLRAQQPNEIPRMQSRPMKITRDDDLGNEEDLSVRTPSSQENCSPGVPVRGMRVNEEEFEPLSPPRTDARFLDQAGFEMSPIRKTQQERKRITPSPSIVSAPSDEQTIQRQRTMEMNEGERKQEQQEPQSPPGSSAPLTPSQTLTSPHKSVDTSFISEETCGEEDYFTFVVCAVVIQAAARRFFARLRVGRMLGIYPAPSTTRRPMVLDADLASEGSQSKNFTENDNFEPQTQTRTNNSEASEADVTAYRSQEPEDDGRAVKTKAAVLIQANFRGWWVRDSLFVDNYCAQSLQAAVRGYLARNRYCAMWRAIVSLQSFVRMFIAQEMAAIQLAHVMAIQALARGYLIRKQLRRKVEASEEEDAESFSEHVAFLQWTKQRHEEEQNRQEQRKAAIIIQTYWRGYFTQLGYLHLLAYILLCQSVVRRWLGQRRALERYEEFMAIQREKERNTKRLARKEKHRRALEAKRLAEQRARVLERQDEEQALIDAYPNALQKREETSKSMPKMRQRPTVVTAADPRKREDIRQRIGAARAAQSMQGEDSGASQLREGKQVQSPNVVVSPGSGIRDNPFIKLRGNLRKRTQPAVVTPTITPTSSKAEDQDTGTRTVSSSTSFSKTARVLSFTSTATTSPPRQQAPPDNNSASVDRSLPSAAKSDVVNKVTSNPFLERDKPTRPRYRVPNSNAPNQSSSISEAPAAQPKKVMSGGAASFWSQLEQQNATAPDVAKYHRKVRGSDH